MKNLKLLIILFFLTNAFSFDVFEPESRIVAKKQIYYESAEKIYFHIHFISARYGKPYKDKRLKEEFEKQEWYKVNPNYHDSLLNKIDKQNIENLTGIHNSLTKHIEELKNLKGKITWKKEVNFIDDNKKENLTYSVTKTDSGFNIEYYIENKGKIFHSEKFKLFESLFENECRGYFYDGIYEAVAHNFEFINIEFYPDSRTLTSVKYWLKDNRNLNDNEAENKTKKYKEILTKFNGDALYAGDRGGGIFPHEFIYLKEENAFVCVYTP